jgi:diadenylate cyclase
MLTDFFLSFKWINLIDILVISFLVHRIFLMLRGSNAFQMLLGLAFLLLLQAAAKLGGLVLTGWFLSGLGAISLVAMVILFRREIRELLIMTNPVRFFLGSRPPSQLMHDLEPLIPVIFKMAQNRTGAIIVFQNKDTLSERLHNGYELNSQVLPQILESIFTKNSPIHDGAIVISRNRIKWVGTYLPLTTREGLPKGYGTRHRAAVGLTELTDAVVIVISEESGEVVLVERGRVKRMRDEQHLHQHIKRFSIDPTAQRKFAARTRSWLARTAEFAMILAAVAFLWSIYFSGQSLIQIDLPIDYRNIPTNLILEDSSAEIVTIQISGSRLIINDLDTGDSSIFVDLTGYENGTHSINLGNKNVELPTGLEVIQITPSQITLELDRIIRKTMTVKPLLIGDLPDTHTINYIRVSPENVSVSGPSSELNSREILYTTPIDLKEIIGNQFRAVYEVEITLPHAAIELQDRESEKVTVTVGLNSKDSPA